MNATSGPHGVPSELPPEGVRAPMSGSGSGPGPEPQEVDPPGPNTVADPPPEEVDQSIGQDALLLVEGDVISAFHAHIQDVIRGCFWGGKKGTLEIKIMVSPTKGTTVTPVPRIPHKTEVLERAGKIQGGQGRAHPQLVLFE